MKKRFKTTLRKICPLLSSCLLIISLCGVVFVSAEDTESEMASSEAYEPIPKPDDARSTSDILGSSLYYNVVDSNNAEFSTYFPFGQFWKSSSTLTPSYQLFYLEADPYSFGTASISHSTNSLSNDVLSILIEASSGSPFRTFDDCVLRFEFGRFFLYDLNNQFTITGDAHTPLGDATTTISIIYQYTGSTSQYYYSTSFVGEWVFTARDFLSAIEYDGLPLYVDSIVISTSYTGILPSDSLFYMLTSTLSEHWGAFQNDMYNTNLDNASNSDPDPDPDPDPEFDIELIFRDYTSWIATAVGAFFSFQLFPGFYLGGILVIIIAFSLVMWWLKMFGGG